MLTETPPVLLIIFKRPETTEKVFQAIRRAKPGKLFIAADGPRSSRQGERELCDQTRNVVSKVDWPCEVQTLFRDENVGIKKHISTAITWFLDSAGEGIILEDDCYPHSDFFKFCGLMLDRYRDDSRVFQISGSSFKTGTVEKQAYYFSRYNHGWGWATWKSAWDKLDLEMVNWSDFKAAADGTDFWDSPKEKKYWTRIFNLQAEGKINTWDFPWKFTLWMQGGLAVYPNHNMVSNLGFNDQGTNTTAADVTKADRPWTDLPAELSHWPEAEIRLRDRRSDRWTFQHLYWGTFMARLSSRIQKILKLMGMR